MVSARGFVHSFPSTRLPVGWSAEPEKSAYKTITGNMAATVAERAPFV